MACDGKMFGKLYKEILGGGAIETLSMSWLWLYGLMVIELMDLSKLIGIYI